MAQQRLSNDRRQCDRGQFASAMRGCCPVAGDEAVIVSPHRRGTGRTAWCARHRRKGRRVVRAYETGLRVREMVRDPEEGPITPVVAGVWWCVRPRRPSILQVRSKAPAPSSTCSSPTTGRSAERPRTQPIGGAAAGVARSYTPVSATLARGPSRTPRARLLGQQERWKWNRRPASTHDQPQASLHDGETLDPKRGGVPRPSPRRIVTPLRPTTVASSRQTQRRDARRLPDRRGRGRGVEMEQNADHARGGARWSPSDRPNDVGPHLRG